MRTYVYVVCAYQFSIILWEIDVLYLLLLFTCTRKHVRAFDYRTHAHQLDFINPLKKPVRTEAAQKDLKPWHKSIRRGESDSLGSIFVGILFWKLFRKKVKIDQTKIDLKDLDSPCQELSVRGFGFVVALLLCPGIGFSCESTWGSIQL